MKSLQAPIKFLGFRSVRETGTTELSGIALDLIRCLKNAWGRDNQDIFTRHIEYSYGHGAAKTIEIALVKSQGITIESVQSLINCDLDLEELRAEYHSIGEIKPDGNVTFVLITISN